MSTELTKKAGDELASVLGSNLSLDVRPDFIPASGDGGEGITANDIRLPRLTIAQGLSKEMIPSEPVYIKGLAITEMFNDFTREIYGNGPLFIIPLMRDVRAIEFKPRSEGGGVVDLNVPLNDKRLEWRNDPANPGKRLPPVATKFTEYVVMILRSNGEHDPAVLSIKETNKHYRRAITDLNGFIKFYAERTGGKAVPIYGVVYAVKTISVTNDKGTFGVPVIEPAGFVPTTELLNTAKAMRESLIGKNIITNRDSDTTDAEAIDGEVVDGERVPF